MHNRLPAHRRHDERREQGGYRRADIARAKDPKSRASPLRRVEARDVGDARSECAARNPYADACEKKMPVAFGQREETGGQRRDHHCRAKTRRPPNRSAQTPRGTRAIEPDTIGTPTSSPNSVPDSTTWTVASTPMTEKLFPPANPTETQNGTPP